MGGIQWWHFLVMLVLLALFVGTLISIARAPGLSPSAKVIWIVVCLILPLVGTVVWFSWGRHRDPSRTMT